MPGESCVIRCFAKLRPAVTGEAGKMNLKLTNEKVTLPIDGTDSSYTFDGVYDADAPMKTIYKDKCEPMLHRLVEGSDVALVALGKTGSGKSYLMNGVDEFPGIVPSMITGLFEVIERMKNKEFFVTVSYVDVIENELVDLINPHSTAMKVRKPQNSSLFIEGLSELVVQNADQLLEYYDQGTRARKHGTTDSRMHQELASSIMTIHIEQKEPGRSSVALKSHLSFVDLAGIETEACKNLIEVISDLSKKNSPPYRDDKLTFVLQEIFGGNSLTSVFATLHPDGSSNRTTFYVSQMLRMIKHNVTINVDDTDKIVSNLRADIASMRERVLHTPNKENVLQLQELVSDLQRSKQQTWEEKQKRSQQYEQERRTNLANKGILEWVMDSKQKHKFQIEERLRALQLERDKLRAEYKTSHEDVQQLTNQLQQQIQEHATLSNSGKASTSDIKTRLTAIHNLKDQLKQATDNKNSLKVRLKDIQERVRMEREEASQSTSTQSSSEMAYLVEIEERKRIEAENAQMIKDEVEKSKLEVEHESANIKMKVIEGKTHTSQELAHLETKICELSHEKPVVALEIQTLKQERDRLVKVTDDQHHRHRQEMDKQQLQHLQTFRNYREMFDKHKVALESRYRTLLEESIQDSVYLSTRNSELESINAQLREEVARLKDRITQGK